MEGWGDASRRPHEPHQCMHGSSKPEDLSQNTVSPLWHPLTRSLHPAGTGHHVEVSAERSVSDTSHVRSHHLSSTVQPAIVVCSAALCLGGEPHALNLFNMLHCFRLLRPALTAFRSARVLVHKRQYASHHPTQLTFARLAKREGACARLICSATAQQHDSKDLSVDVQVTYDFDAHACCTRCASTSAPCSCSG